MSKALFHTSLIISASASSGTKPALLLKDSVLQSLFTLSSPLMFKRVQPLFRGALRFRSEGELFSVQKTLLWPC